MNESINSINGTVFVVDDDASVRRSMTRLLRSGGYAVEAFSTATEFLASGRQHESRACLLLDVQMPGLSGTELQEQLHASGSTISIIFVSAHGDIPMTVQVMRHGAVDFLPKPFDADLLLKSVTEAIEKTVRNVQERSERETIERRLETLTPREREVMDLIVTGMLNKQVAGELGTVEKTIKVHRGRVMEKMQVKSLAELARLAERMAVWFSTGTPRRTVDSPSLHPALINVASNAPSLQSPGSQKPARPGNASF